jgi:hypothetical protein
MRCLIVTLKIMLFIYLLLRFFDLAVTPMFTRILFLGPFFICRIYPPTLHQKRPLKNFSVYFDHLILILYLLHFLLSFEFFYFYCNQCSRSANITCILLHDFSHKWSEFLFSKFTYSL